MPVPSAKLRIVLAALLLNAGRVVPVDAIAEVLWGPVPPRSARVSVQNHVMRLRRVLGEAGRDRIITRPPGYLIRVGADELDLTRCEALLAAARAATGDGVWDQAAAHAREASALWRGEALADVDSEVLAIREVPRLAELRLQAVETRIDADLHLGRHGEVIAELRQLTRAHPLRERLHGLLMLALYQDGRQAEALAAYQDIRRVLVEELGAEPGAGMRKLHQQILAADPALAASAGALPVAHAAQGLPHELPTGIRYFTGRAGELQALTGLLNRTGDQTHGAVVISAISGMAGVGKTALAVHWAHQVADRFPGGQLYVNLRGYDLDKPMSAADALARFLRALGMPGQDIPPEEDERAVRYRSLLSGKRLLIVLDNARSAEQVRPLLPGSAACVVMVTSRDTLAGLVAREGATRLDLDMLPMKDAIGLLKRLIGQRVDVAPEAASELADQCCRLPLALRVAAELAASRPDAPLAELTSELGDQRDRLDLLEAGGDPRTAVRAVFSWSYRHLDADTARMFRLAGWHPGPGFDPYAAAALTGTSLEQARRALDVLARAHLIQPTGSGRWSLHDLLRAYARELAASHDGEDQRDVALTRLFDYYLHTASVAMDALYPAEGHIRPRISSPATSVPPVTNSAVGGAWLDAERATLLAVTVHAAEHGWPAHAVRLGATLFRYLDVGSYCLEAITVHTHARAAALRIGDRAAEATALNHLAGTYWRQSRYQEATDHLSQAMILDQQTGDRTREAYALSNLGIVYSAQGQYQQAARLHEQALELFRHVGDRAGEARSLNNLGETEERLGSYQRAARQFQQSLAIARDTHDRPVECTALINLGTVGLRLGLIEQAANYLSHALALTRETGNRYHHAEALTRMGDVCLRQGLPREAADHLQQALALCREIGERACQADALNSFGEALLAVGEHSHACTEHTTALCLASEIGDRYQQARAHHGLARAQQAVSDLDQARCHWQQAITLYAELGTPEANQFQL